MRKISVLNTRISPAAHMTVVFPNALQHCGLLLHDGSVDYCHNNWFISSVTAIVSGDHLDVTEKSYILTRILALVDCGSTLLTQKF